MGDIMPKPLTAKTIENLKPQADRYEVRDGTRNLYVVVYPSGKKQFICRYRFGGKKKKTTFPGVSLEAARVLTEEWMLKINRGIDPMIEKRREADADADTVQAICEEYLKLEGKSLRTIEQREELLKRLVYPEIGAEPIETLTRSRIARALDKIRIKGERTADLARAYLNVVFEWHAARSDTFSNPIVKRLRRYKPAEHVRERTLTNTELRAMWKATEKDDPASALIRFLLLTGARRSEAAGLKWSEIEGDVWTLPADAGPNRNKTKRDLQRPLSKAALAVVNSQPHIKDSPLVFSHDGRRMLSFSLLKQNIDKASGVTGWTLHDLRRTARTLLSGCVDVSVDLAELCIGHTKKGVRATYDQHTYLSEMRAAFEKLSRRIELIVNPPRDNIRQLRG
jgi:integrase